MSELLLSNTNSNGEVTPNFGLEKQARDDRYGIDKFNDNMEVIDEEMHRPPLTVNQIEPDENRDIQITTVPLADNLTSDEAQINTGTYIIRTSGGESSVANGPAWLTEIKGNQVKTGYVAESLQMTVNGSNISAEIDRDTFVEAVTASGTITLNYTSAWSSDPANYGITVNGTPANGDSIVVVYVKENRGTITTANPTSFISTGWNLYNHTAGYARVTNYSEEYGFMIDGTYTALEFAETISGTRQTITPVNGFFTVPADGYVFVTGGNGTDTAIWMTWSDWTEEANGGVFQAYTQTAVDLSGLMVSFPDGLMRIGNVYDEINLNTQRAYSRIQKVEYTEENLADIVALGVPYDVDTYYIYYVRQNPVTLTISLSGEYTVSDHGIEFFNGTAVPVVASSLYGQDLKGKLRRDVLTISAQELTSAQQAQVQNNIGLVPTMATNKTSAGFVADARAIKALYDEVFKTDANETTVYLNSSHKSYFRYKKVRGVVLVEVIYDVTTDGGIASWGTKSLGTLPSGYRPTFGVNSRCAADRPNGAEGACIVVESSGNVAIWSMFTTLDASVSGNIVKGSISYFGV